MHNLCKRHLPGQVWVAVSVGGVDTITLMRADAAPGACIHHSADCWRRGGGSRSLLKPARWACHVILKRTQEEESLVCCDALVWKPNIDYFCVFECSCAPKCWVCWTQCHSCRSHAPTGAPFKPFTSQRCARYWLCTLFSYTATLSPCT